MLRERSLLGILWEEESRRRGSQEALASRAQRRWRRHRGSLVPRRRGAGVDVDGHKDEEGSGVAAG